MIPFASQRGLGQDLATHLLNAQDNERAELVDVRGAVARDLHGAFAEWEAQAHALTKCRNYLYSLSINPDPAQGPLTRAQYEDYIARVEDKLGLTGQPRAVVFHEKYGREHCHVVWSRIDTDNEKAVRLAFDKDKLMTVTREFARDHGLHLPDGYERDKSAQEKAGQVSLYDMHQQRATGLTREERIAQVTQAWHASDSAKAFVQALAERGYILATGKRPYVLVDLYGEMNALPKLIADKSVRTADIREFLGAAIPPESLPSVEEARKRAAAHRKHIEAHLENERRESAVDELETRQKVRREALDKDQAALRQRQHREREDLAVDHKGERATLRDAHLAQTRHIRQEREQNKSRGLAAFLGRVTGVAAIRKQLQKFQDRQRVRAFVAQRDQLKDRQHEKQLELRQRQEMQRLEMARKVRALEAVAKRERAALEQALVAEARFAQRGGENRIPAVPFDLSKERSITLAKDLDQRDRHALEREMEEEFTAGATGKTRPAGIDLVDAFFRAAQDDQNEEKQGSSEGPKPAAEDKIKRYGPKRGKENEIDRGR